MNILLPTTASARNIRFLDRAEKIIYPCTRDDWYIRQSKQGDKKGSMIWAVS